ncbi:acyl-CoA synthetase, putative, partial [Ixodes scapularis]
DVFLGCESITHAFGFFFTMFGVCTGTTTVMWKPDAPMTEVAGAIKRHKITAVVCFPVMLHKLSEHVELTGVTLDTVKKILFTGGCIPTTLGRKIRSQFSLECFRNLYGLSEALSPACMPSWDETDCNNIGFPSGLVQLNVVDVETGLPVGPYRTGELHIKAPTVTRGYSRKTGTVSAVDEGGWLASGDLVYYNEDGRFYYYERMKSLIKCLDYEVSPSELEEILLSNPFVAEAVVVGVLHPEFGEVAKAFVVLKDSACPGMSPTSEELQEFVAARTAFFKHLYGGVVIVQSIPKTRTGKAKRQKLKETGKTSKTN